MDDYPKAEERRRAEFQERLAQEARAARARRAVDDYEERRRRTSPLKSGLLTLAIWYIILMAATVALWAVSREWMR